MESLSGWAPRGGRRTRRIIGCPNCRDFVWDQLQRNPFDIFFSRPQEIAQTASNGCSSCHVLFKALENCYPYAVNSPGDYRLAFHGFEGPMRWDLFHPKEDVRHATRANKFIELFSRREEECPWDLVGPADHVSYDLENAIQQAQIWLSDCRTKHPKCAVQHAATLPSRVVRISPLVKQSSSFDPVEIPKVRLYETSEGEGGQYVCLSHCWGKNPIITTKTTNIEDYKVEIPWSELSRTFQDAIIFAAHMDIENIWIDSLCIIQNSSEDWATEALKMASYYTNSEFTIAATGSTDGAGGLYHATPLEEMSIEIEGIDSKTQSRFRVGARRPVAHLHDVLEDRNKIVERFPLLSRGWVYQERILSRRFLHFGPREIHWECHQEVACQCGGGKAALEMNPSGANTANQGLAITNSRMRVDEMVLLWVGQIQNLTSLNFTFISDQLPALSGIATLVRQSQPSGRYLAGLWEEGLLFWLCWATQGVTDKPKALHDTPSWSWASVQGRISFDYMQFYFTQGPWGERGHKYMLLVNAAQVHVHQCTPSNPSLSGKLDVGILSITAPIVRATLHCRREKSSGEEVLGLSLQDKEATESGKTGGKGFVYPFQWDTCDDSIFTSDLDGRDILVVHLLTYERLNVEYDGPSWMRAFLIVKPVDENEIQYQRLGILCTDITGGFLPSVNWRDLAKRHQGERTDIEGGFLKDFRRVSSTRVIYLV